MFVATEAEFESIEVEYITMPGWCSNTESVREFSNLPQKAQEYVRRIEELTGVPSTYSILIYDIMILLVCTLYFYHDINIAYMHSIRIS